LTAISSHINRSDFKPVTKGINAKRRRSRDRRVVKFSRGEGKLLFESEELF